MKTLSRWAAVGCLAGLLLGQQPPPTPPRAPTPPLTAAELDAIPLTQPRAGATVKKTLFDGKTLDGWEGNPAWWSVRDGSIVGKFDQAVPTSFLFTKDKYSDFRLTLASKMVASENHAGVCFWGDVVTKGENPWYTRGPLVMFPNPGMWDYIDAKGIPVYRFTTEKVTAQHDWITVEILAQGNRVRTALNGVAVMDWREADASRVKPGPIGIQLHAWKAAQEVMYKEIVVETFPTVDQLITVKR